jgi:hypothetical protein
MSTTAAAELARLRTRFSDWDIVRTQCGTLIARHLATGDRVTARTVTELEKRLIEWVMYH